jgi:hypothetical protein
MSRPESVQIALLLKREWRTPGGVARVRVIAATLGIDVTGVGEAAISGTMSRSLYQFLFGLDGVGEEPNIAEPLCDLIESVSIIPSRERA